METREPDAPPPWDYVPDFWWVALRAARLLRGYSVREVANATGVPEGRLKSIEAKRTEPAPEEFGAIWSFLSTEPTPKR